MSENEQRDKDGKWTAGAAEQSTRDAGRYPVAPHVAKSVGTHTAGDDFSAADIRGIAAVAPFEGAPGPEIHAGSGWGKNELEDYASE
jgi:hypothetical protein